MKKNFFYILILTLFFQNNFAMKGKVFKYIHHIKRSFPKYIISNKSSKPSKYDYPIHVKMLKDDDSYITPKEIFVQSKIKKNEVHIGTIIKHMVCGLDQSFQETKSGKNNDFIPKELNLHITKGLMPEHYDCLFEPLMGRYFSEKLPGLDKCIKKGIKTLGKDCCFENLLEYVGKEYFNISDNKDFNHNSYYVNIGNRKKCFLKLSEILYKEEKNHNFPKKEKSFSSVSNNTKNKKPNKKPLDKISYKIDIEDITKVIAKSLLVNYLFGPLGVLVYLGVVTTFSKLKRESDWQRIKDESEFAALVITLIQLLVAMRILEKLREKFKDAENNGYKSAGSIKAWQEFFCCPLD
ncbi:hypothetical protein ACFLYU_01140 [Candidatus Dependentiae bacterium]